MEDKREKKEYAASNACSISHTAGAAENPAGRIKCPVSLHIVWWTGRQVIGAPIALLTLSSTSRPA